MKNFKAVLALSAACILGVVSPSLAESVFRLGEIGTAEPPSLDITTSVAQAIPSALLYNVMETLIQIDDSGKLQPLLAEKWTVSDDGLVYNFHLRENVFFHDGEPLTAEDVAWVLNHGRTHEGHAQGFAFKGIESVTVVDAKTVSVVLKAPDSIFLVNMAKRPGIIFPERAAKDMGKNPVGTGPFQFVEWNRGESLIFKRFDKYWGAAPKIDRIEWHYIPDPNAGLNALLAGDVDAIRRLYAVSRIEEVKANPKLVVSPGATSAVNLLSINHKVPPFDNVRVRQAIAHAVDSQAIIDGMNNGFGTWTRVFASPIDAYFDGTYDPYPYDPEKSKAILAEEGLSGMDVKITAITNNPSILEAEILMGQLSAAGFNPSLESFDLPTGLDKIVNKRAYQLAPLNVISERLVTNMTCEVLWYQNYCSPKFDALIQEGRAAHTPQETTEAFRKATHVAADEVMVVPFYAEQNIGVHWSYVSGWRPYHPDTAVDLRNIEINR